MAADIRTGGGGGQRRGGGQMGTTLYDSIYLACDEVVKKQQGRKALILLTDGVDHGSKYTLSMAIESAQRADTMVYSVLFADPHGYGNNNGPIMSGPGMGRRRGMGYPAGATPLAAGIQTAATVEAAQTARRSCSRLLTRRAGASSKLPRRSLSTRYTTRSKRSFAANTASDTLPLRLPTRVDCTARSL